MREKLFPWKPLLLCGVLSLMTVVADVVGRFATDTPNVGLLAFICFLPTCFFLVGESLKKLRDENLELQRRLDAMLLKDNEDRQSAA